MEKKKQEELQKKYIELEIYDKQLKQIQEQVEKFDTQMQELSSISESLGEIGKVQAGNEILVPVSTGIFAKAKVDRIDKFVVNVGASVAVERSVDETVTLIDEQMLEITKHRNHLAELFTDLSERAQMLQAELQKMIE